MQAVLYTEEWEKNTSAAGVSQDVNNFTVDEVALAIWIWSGLNSYRIQLGLVRDGADPFLVSIPDTASELKTVWIHNDNFGSQFAGGINHYSGLRPRTVLEQIEEQEQAATGGNAGINGDDVGVSGDWDDSPTQPTQEGRDIRRNTDTAPPVLHVRLAEWNAGNATPADRNSLALIFDIPVERVDTILDGAEPQTLVHVALQCSGKQPSGCNFFTNNTFGVWTETIVKLRAQLSQGEPTTLHILSIETTLPLYVREVISDIRKEHQSPIIDRWWPRGFAIPVKKQHLSEADRPRYIARPQYTFSSSSHYTTVFWYATLGELEAESKKRSDVINAAARFLEIAECGNRAYIVFLEQTKELGLRIGDSFMMNLNAQRLDSQQDWSGSVVDSMPYALPTDLTAIVRRRYIPNPAHVLDNDEADEEILDPTEIPSESLVCVEDQTSLHGVRARLMSIPSVNIRIELLSSSQTIERQCGAMHHMYKGLVGGTYKVHGQPILGSGELFSKLRADNLMSLPTVDIFHPLLEDGVEAADLDQHIAGLLPSLTPEQQEIFKGLRKAQGGLVLISGGAGTGKSYIMRLIIGIFLFFTTGDKHALLLIVSALNINLDDLVLALQKDHSGKVIIRAHAYDTERGLFKVLEAGVRKGKHPSIHQPDPSQPTNFNDLLAAEAYLSFYNRLTKQKHEGVKDRRVNLLEHSLAFWMLRAAGYGTKDGKPHEYAPTDYIYRFKDFRTYMSRYKRQEFFTPADKQAFSEAANKLRDWVFEHYDILLLSGSAALDPGFRTVKTKALFFDEAAKLHELELAGIMFFHPLKPVIAVGDPNQLVPVCLTDKSEDGSAPFGAQNTVSLFNRLIVAGYEQYVLTICKRCHSDILDLLNTFANWKMRADPAVDLNPSMIKAGEIMRLMTGKSERHAVWVRHVGTVGYVGYSKVNLDSVMLILSWYYSMVIKYNVAPQDVAIIAAYEAQRRLLIAAKAHMAAFISKTNPRLANRMNDTLVFTFDASQSIERPFVLVDPVISSDPGFLLKVQRLAVAVSRASAYVVIFGNIDGIESFIKKAKWIKNSALIRIIEWMKKKDAIVDVPPPDLAIIGLDDFDRGSREDANEESGNGNGNDDTSAAEDVAWG